MEKYYFNWLNVLNICFIISILLHFSALYLSTFSAIEGEINLQDYKMVQLMDMEVSVPSVSRVSEQGEGDIKITDNKKVETKEFPKEEIKTENQNKGDGFSMYLPFFKVAQLPEFITKITPEYPARAKLRGQESEVLIESYIDEYGITRKVVIIKSGGEDFDNSVIDALHKSKFKPAISKEGKPVPVRVRIPFKFELE